MAITRKGHSLIMNAVGDVATENAVRCRQIRLTGTGLTPGGAVVIKEVDTNGAVIASGVIAAANENAVLWQAEGDGSGPGSFIRKPYIDVLAGGQVLFQLV